MILKKFKLYSEKALEPVSRYLNSKGINPNTITIAGLILSIISAVLYYIGSFKVAGISLAASGFCDLLDGNMARVNEKTSKFGAFFDSTVDRYSDMAVMIGIMGYACNIRDKELFILGALALIGSVMVSYTRARAECIIERCDVGIMERPERVVTLIAASILDFMKLGLILIAVLGNLTAIHRIYYTYKKTKEDAHN